MSCSAALAKVFCRYIYLVLSVTQHDCSWIACIAVVGSVEELASSERTRTLVADQFETNYLGPVNMIKASLVQMRKQKSGHILSLGGISMWRSLNEFTEPICADGFPAGHIGTPGLGVYCAAGWALEGYCDVTACPLLKCRLF